MKANIFFMLIFCSLGLTAHAKQKSQDENLTYYSADNPNFQYTGRIDFSNPQLPRFWAPGVYIKAKFKGTSCEIQVNDEIMWNKTHNYITVVIDNNPAQRIKLKEKENKLKIAEHLDNKEHTLLICKGTEAGIGYLEFKGITVKKLLRPEALPNRKIEFIGNSITCGTGSDTSLFPCGTGEWHDQHNAYMSYGPTTARMLNARWVQSSVSGIGLTHSCCNLGRIMPEVFDKVNMNNNSIPWDFSKYQPDVVTIMLGQNDGIQDSAFFCRSYINFLHRIRGYYPKATIICLTSPMADDNLCAFMKKSLTSIVETINKTGDTHVYRYFFSKRYHGGCDEHPNLAEHAEIAKELSGFIRKFL